MEEENTTISQKAILSHEWEMGGISYTFKTTDANVEHRRWELLYMYVYLFTYIYVWINFDFVYITSHIQ